MFKKSFFIFSILFSFIIQLQAQEAEHVILIGIDGLGANYLQEIENVPNIKKMMKNGSHSMEARCIRPSSSAANWAAMTMGAGPELTGYTKWDSQTPEIPSRVKGDYDIFPTIFELLRKEKSDAEIGVIYTWSGIGYLYPKEVIDKDLHTNSDSLTLAKATEYIETDRPNLLFLHFDNVDGAGHGIGWGTDEYREAVEKMDERIGAILESVKKAGIEDKTVILTTADHGGSGQNHGGDDINEMEIPWIITGPGIKKDYQLKGSVMTFDTAATIAEIFELTPPQVWIGRPVTEAFE